MLLEETTHRSEVNEILISFLRLFVMKKNISVCSVDPRYNFDSDNVVIELFFKILYHLKDGDVILTNELSKSLGQYCDYIATIFDDYYRKISPKICKSILSQCDSLRRSQPATYKEFYTAFLALVNEASHYECLTIKGNEYGNGVGLFDSPTYSAFSIDCSQNFIIPICRKGGLLSTQVLLQGIFFTIRFFKKDYSVWPVGFCPGTSTVHGWKSSPIGLINHDLLHLRIFFSFLKSNNDQCRDLVHAYNECLVEAQDQNRELLEYLMLFGLHEDPFNFLPIFTEGDHSKFKMDHCVTTAKKLMPWVTMELMKSALNQLILAWNSIKST